MHLEDPPAAAFRALLVPVDGSESSAVGARMASQLARLSGGHITLLHVVDEREHDDDEVLAAPAEPLHQARRGPFAIACDAMGLTIDDVGHRVAFGDPARAIVAAAEQGADLIVLGSRGGVVTGIHRDSVTRAVIDHAPCAVLLVPILG